MGLIEVSNVFFIMQFISAWLHSGTYSANHYTNHCSLSSKYNYSYKYGIACIKTLQCQGGKKWVWTKISQSMAYLRHTELIWLFHYRGHEVLQIREKELDFEVMNYTVIHKKIQVVILFPVLQVKQEKILKNKWKTRFLLHSKIYFSIYIWFVYFPPKIY